MSNPDFESHDCRLTAYALGELDATARAQFEEELDANPEWRTQLAELRDLAGLLREELSFEPKPSLTGGQRNALLAQLNAPPVQPAVSGVDRGSRLRRWAVIGGEVAVGAAVIIGLFEFASRRSELSKDGLSSSSRPVAAPIEKSVDSGLAAHKERWGVKVASNAELDGLEVAETAGLEAKDSSANFDTAYGSADLLIRQARPVDNRKSLVVDAIHDGRPLARDVVRVTESEKPSEKAALGIGVAQPEDSVKRNRSIRDPQPDMPTHEYAVPPVSGPVTARHKSASPKFMTQPESRGQGLAKDYSSPLAEVELLVSDRRPVQESKPVRLDDLADLDGEPQTKNRKESLSLPQLRMTDELSPRDYEAYETPVENAFLTPAEQPLSTFSIDVDSASYANARRFLSRGQLPPAGAIRIEEMINYFSYNYPQPKADEPFSVTADAAPCPWQKSHYLARIGLQARTIDKAKRPPTNLVFLLDVSGSMQAANKLPLVKQAMSMLVEELNDRDRIAIVTYAGDAGLKLSSTPGSDQARIIQAIESLQAGGSTNGAAGINLAYEEALRSFNGEGENRVILCTDGDFNVGVSSDDQLVELIQTQAKTKVFLSIFGFGMGNLKDAKLEKLADKGNGHYGYIDDLREARRVFSEELVGTLYTVAKDVKIQVEFNPMTVGSYRLIGYENRALAARDFNDDTKDAGEIGAGHTVTALYEIVPKKVWLKQKSGDDLKYSGPSQDQAAPAGKEIPPGSADDLFTVKLRYKPPMADASVKTVDYVVDDIQDKKIVPSADFLWAASVASFAMQLRQSSYQGDWKLEDVLETAKGALEPQVDGVTSLALTRLDPIQAANSLKNLFPGNAPPKFEADSTGHRLLVQGTADQLAQVRGILQQLGERGESDTRRQEFVQLVETARRLTSSQNSRGR